MEDIVIWHQQQLSMINEAFGDELPFNESEDKVVYSLQNKVFKLQDELNHVKDEMGRNNILAEKRLKLANDKIEALMTGSAEEQQKFEKIQVMFTAEEANVLRQRRNVLISAHGFEFPSGKSEIEAVNFPLMNKIITAIYEFPGAKIEISGHTDSTGDDRTNQVLSEQRAQKVAKFLIDVGHVAPASITFRGFGESRPVASNETHEGRAENRRVEVKIINDYILKVKRIRFYH